MEKFVTPEITKKLKERGFPVVEYIDGKFGLTETTIKYKDPHIYDVILWLEEEKQIFLEVYPKWFIFHSHPLATKKIKWCYEIYTLTEPFYKETDYGEELKLQHLVYSFNNIHETWEEAALAGIEDILNHNLI